MKKRILSILLLCCMVLTMMPATVFAADEEVAARASETGGLYEHHEACGADPAGTSDTMMPKTRSGAARPAATQYTYTLHYDANGGSGAPPSQSVTSSEFHVWVPISEIIPTRDGYTFMGWANYRTGTPIYGGNGGYTECLVVHGVDMSTTIYAIWEVHNHSWGEWTSNGNGTHTRTCTADSSHTETGNCSGGKATSTEKAVCETCHTAYGALLQPAKTVITTPPTLPLPGYIGNEYTDRALRGGEAKAESTDTVAPGTFSFKNASPFYLQTPGEHDVTVVFTPDDLRLHKPTEITIKINAVKNTIRNIDEPDPITDKPFGTPFAELGLPENVCINAVDGAWRWIDVAWDESSYDAESVDWQTIIGTPVLSEDDGDIFQQPEPAVTAAIRVKLIDNRPPMPPTIVAESLPDGMEGEAYSNRLTAKGTAPITWSIVSGVLPEGLSLNEDTGEISGTPAGEGTEVFTVMAVNDLGEDIKEFSITIVKAPEAEYAVTVRDDGHGTGSADPASATAGTEITLTATPNAGYHFKDWQVMSGDVTVRDDKFTMPGSDVEVKAIFEEDAPPTPTEYTVTVKTDGNGTASASHAKAVVGTEITLTATPNAGYHFKEWQVMSGDVTVRDDKFTMPGSDVEVKAIFEEDAPPTPTEYTVTFDGNDGTPSVGSMTTTKQKLTSLPDASRSKHSFNGWYTEKSGGTKITTDTVFSANTTVYAHWTHTGDNNPPVNYYTLRFETGGGSAIPSVRETYNTYMDLTKYVPTRHGYTFVGWYSEQSLVNKVSDIYLTGDMTVYAGWRAVTIPQTGDSGQMNLWSTALCASFAGCVALIVWKIRRREKNHCKSSKSKSLIFRGAGK